MTEVTAPDLPSLDGTEPVAAVEGAPPVKAKKARAKKEVDPNAPPKAPKEPKVKSPYNRDATSIIRITDKPFGGKGQRAEWWTRVSTFANRTCQEFSEGNQGIVNGKGNPEPPMGWLRFFVQEGFVNLEAVPVSAEAAPAEATPAAPAEASPA
jgi:hypothetical protein